MPTPKQIAERSKTYQRAYRAGLEDGHILSTVALDRALLATVGGDYFRDSIRKRFIVEADTERRSHLAAIDSHVPDKEDTACPPTS